MQAIPTTYRGIRYRSRLEARWATFFDELHIRYAYEPKAFTHEGENYVPDFYLPATKTWVEVKPSFNNLSTDTWWTFFNAVEYGGFLDDVCECYGTTRGLLLLDGLPDRNMDDLDSIPVHPLLQHHKGVWINPTQFTFRGLIPRDHCNWTYQCLVDDELSRMLTGDRFPKFMDMPIGSAAEVHEAYRRAKYTRF